MHGFTVVFVALISLLSYSNGQLGVWSSVNDVVIDGKPFRFEPDGMPTVMLQPVTFSGPDFGNPNPPVTTEIPVIGDNCPAFDLSYDDVVPVVDLELYFIALIPPLFYSFDVPIEIKSGFEGCFVGNGGLDLECDPLDLTPIGGILKVPGNFPASFSVTAECGGKKKRNLVRQMGGAGISLGLPFSSVSGDPHFTSLGDHSKFTPEGFESGKYYSLIQHPQVNWNAKMAREEKEGEFMTDQVFVVRNNQTQRVAVVELSPERVAGHKNDEKETDGRIVIRVNGQVFDVEHHDDSLHHFVGQLTLQRLNSWTVLLRAQGAFEFRVTLHYHQQSQSPFFNVKVGVLGDVAETAKGILGQTASSKVPYKGQKGWRRFVKTPLSQYVVPGGVNLWPSVRS